MVKAALAKRDMERGNAMLGWRTMAVVTEPDGHPAQHVQPGGQAIVVRGGGQPAGDEQRLFYLYRRNTKTWAVPAPL
ncbi:MAG: hypothetical protein IPG51_24725 [Chloroflexi bacterium]|nr:hypothetical protein [Chloroflexota bacterium]